MLVFHYPHLFRLYKHGFSKYLPSYLFNSNIIIILVSHVFARCLQFWLYKQLSSSGPPLPSFCLLRAKKKVSCNKLNVLGPKIYRTVGIPFIYLYILTLLYMIPVLKMHKSLKIVMPMCNDIYLLESQNIQNKTIKIIKE